MDSFPELTISKLIVLSPIGDPNTGLAYVVGYKGTTKIDLFEKPAEYNNIPYYRVWRGEHLAAMFCAHKCVGIELSQPQPDEPELPLGKLTLSLTDYQVDYMVSRFLNWVLPSTFKPDGGIEYKRPDHPHHGPLGTNVFDSVQATAMVRHMIQSLPFENH
jgi:hypothetical protein